MWIPIQKGMNGNGKMLVQQLNPFALNTESTYTPRSFKNGWLSKGLEKQDLLADRFQQEYVSLNLTDNTANAIVVKTNTDRAGEHGTVEPVKAVTIHKNAATFSVIAASFSTKVEAEAYIADMEKRGFGAEYAGQEKGRFLVAYGSYTSLQDAERMLASVSLSNKQARIVSGN